MGLIRILPDVVANKIAAGEVVERPASVAKELLENALDAGAAQVRLEVAAGGRRLMRVVDDGVGMGRDDAMLAFERHATSKLRQAADLLSISTLGFRGEALPSIASVSRLTLETQCDDEPAGTRIEIAGGKIINVTDAGLPRGTSVTVRDLFFNVPARRKFLRSEQTELAHITSMVTHYSLANMDKTIELKNERGQLLQATPVETLRERVYQIFGAGTTDQLVEFGPVDRDLEVVGSPVPRTQAVAAARTGRGEAVKKHFRLSGFVSNPQLQKLNRNSIYIFVNQRLIRDRLLLHAISSAYHNVIPPGTFPFVLLFIELPFDEVDANVHPSKTEVRFRHQSFVHDLVRDTLREALSESKPVSTFPMPLRTQQSAADLPFSEATEKEKSAREGDGFSLQAEPLPTRRLDFGGSSLDLYQKPVTPAGEAGNEETAEGAAATAGILRGAPVAAIPTPGMERAETAGPTAGGQIPWTGTGDQGFQVDDKPHGNAPLMEESPDSMLDLADLHPLGQVQESFIVASGQDGLWIIDQHVAHERILFEKVLRQRATDRAESQRLLMPIIVTLKPEQEVKFGAIEQELRASGFDLEPFGHRTVALKAAPADLSPQQVETLLEEILETPEKELRALSLEDLQRRIAAGIACQAAIKINTPLDQRKMHWLLDELAKTEYPMSCPHGRPIALKYGLKDILKAFHRI